MDMSMPMATPSTSAVPSMTSSMPMVTSGMSASMDMAGMTPYMHFTGGDNLLFKPWVPTSHGAVAGACVGLLLVAIFERWLAAMRALLKRHWQRRAAAAVSAGIRTPDDSSDSKTVGDAESVPLDGQSDLSRKLPRSESYIVEHPHPIVPPFIWQTELSRGALFALQAFIAYILMLSVMTFQAAYLISIVLGLGIGEVIFGRFGSGDGHLFH